MDEDKDPLFVESANAQRYPFSWYLDVFTDDGINHQKNDVMKHTVKL